ncbi:glycosyltransferase family 4 protein [Mesorhizobium muleiense]|uniref:glycosyltransferase family 4 protein n=1 Tax=Mesorhizobium muleiense TaxID=1004279 RepID=UPI001F383B96|nr:glycosyltransferase family 4 protein [Mesorhizobium muleiense]MCF6109012.1 glycosyltransferase family 4 protein [Mesorhizobium muleiense]
MTNVPGHPVSSANSSMCQTGDAKPKVIICANTSWNLANFRSGLIKSLIEDGFDVIALAPFDSYSKQVEAMGCRYVRLDFNGHGKNILGEISLLFRLFKVLKTERPSLFLGFTIKPNVYGSFAARMCRVPVINNIAGLGIASPSASWLSRATWILYRWALLKSAKVFFQNRDDRQLFVDRRIVDAVKTEVLPGSGVDLKKFKIGTRKVADSKCSTVFLFVGRLIWEKGVGEFVEAARCSKASGAAMKFQLLGTIEERNPKSVGREDIHKWMEEGIVEYRGETDDVRPFMEAADCIVLPTYYGEGTPRTLLEAAALGRPIITTNWNGCREVVDDGVSGYLCEPRDARDLFAKCSAFHELARDKRLNMGRAGRRKVEREYDEEIVIGRYRSAIADIRD